MYTVSSFPPHFDTKNWERDDAQPTTKDGAWFRKKKIMSFTKKLMAEENREHNEDKFRFSFSSV